MGYLRVVGDAPLTRRRVTPNGAFVNRLKEPSIVCSYIPTIFLAIYIPTNPLLP